MEKLRVHEYFRQPETMRPMELVYGVVREPPAPGYGHQAVVTRLTELLNAHVKEHGRGRVCVSPMDVVLDSKEALVVQPDIIFIANDRLAIIKTRIWGAPDLVVEISSRSTARRDRTIKVGWYRQYGVRECWLIDVRTRAVEVIELQSTTPARMFSGEQLVRSAVLPDWAVPAEQIFD
jgi:Uma2 family endonuclease